ncbi:MAG: hypothetical protein ACTSYC_11375 [Promethearchaeota archaeon]
MTKTKRDKFSEEERQIIRELRKKLPEMGIPREEWSHYIQQELILRKKEARKKKSEKAPSTFKRMMNKIRKRAESRFQSFLAKRMNVNETAFKELFGDEFSEFSEGEMDLMNAMFSQVNIPKEEELSKHGTFVAERSDKKRMIVSFEDED